MSTNSNKAFDEFIKSNLNLFLDHKKYKNNLMIMDRGRSKGILQSCLLARLVARKFNLNPTLFTTNKKNSWQLKIYSKLGINDIFYSRNIYFFLTNIEDLLKTLINSIFTYFKYKNNFLSFINEFSIEKAEIGHLIYDEYIRDGKKYIKKNIYNLNFFVFLFRKIFIFYKIKKILKKENIKILICNSIDYATHTSIAARIAVTMKIPVLIADDQFMIFKNTDSINKPIFVIEKKNVKDFFKKSKKINFKKYLKRRFSGDLNSEGIANTIGYTYTSKLDVSVANRNKINLNKKSFILKYCSNEKFKKIVLIAPHAFTDAVHGLGKRFIFKDYYDQFVETIKFIYNYDKKDVLWLIKPHPRTKHYKEEGQIEEVLNKYKKKNIILLNKKISTLSAIKISDLVITGRGSIGLEASSLGKKVIIAGYAIYEKLGFTIEPKTKRKYFSEIINEKNYTSLKKSKINEARKYLYYCDNYRKYNLPRSQLEILTSVDFEEKDKIFFQKILKFMQKKKYLIDKYYLNLDKILGSIKITN